VNERRAEQALADQAGAAGTSGCGVLLVERDLEVDRQSATAVPVGQPTQVHPPVASLTFPRHALLDEGVLVTRMPPRCAQDGSNSPLV
jgi:hypothetical protein